MSSGTTTPTEESQLAQTVEMFEVITQSQPQDYQSLEILKEAYIKLKRDEDVIHTSKRIAEAYAMMGQLSSAILEYESILQRRPDDAEVLAALGEIESKANQLRSEDDDGAASKAEQTVTLPRGRRMVQVVDDGREAFRKLFVDGKMLAASDFDTSWSTPDLLAKPKQVQEPFIQVLAEKGLIPIERSLRVLSDKGRFGYLPIGKYDYDVELARGMPAETLLRWCVLPIDRMSKSLLVATANPYNRQAAAELEEASHQRLLWYLAHPSDIAGIIKKIIR